VPHDLWKVILVLSREDAEPQKNTRVISIIMPNDQTVDYDWTRYRTSARKVEELTGNRFFRNVPDDVAEALRDSVDEVKIHVPPAPRSGVGKRRQEEP
jgi:DNA/RNA endonuclease G (NUC1)